MQSISLKEAIARFNELEYPSVQDIEVLRKAIETDPLSKRAKIAKRNIEVILSNRVSYKMDMEACAVFGYWQIASSIHKIRGRLDGKHLIHNAVVCSQLGMAQWLLAKGAPVEENTLNEAVKNPNMAFAAFLIEAGVPLDINCYGLRQLLVSPLFIACCNNNFYVSLGLVAYGANCKLLNMKVGLKPFDYYKGSIPPMRFPPQPFEFNGIPRDVFFQHIYTNLTGRDIFRLTRVSKAFYYAIHAFLRNKLINS